ncbi:MAG: ABC-F type ribosomal protection protein [Eubacteriales bacterium]|jgi:lincosamide and streptogramin A transport system ATP-binding/permease protein
MSLINITNLTFSYDGGCENIFENVSFQIDTDWKLGFTGRNGRGKTTFLNLMMKRFDYSGSISSSVSFEYFPYEVNGELMDTNAVVNTIISGYQDWQFIRELNLLEVSSDVIYRQFNTLSNGEQTKVLLAALFLKENRFLLIDEPTNHLDMNGRRIVSEYLRSKYGFILVSHDRAFLDNCIDHILSINRTNIEIQKGNFSSWWHNKQLQDNLEIARNDVLKRDIKRMVTSARRVSDWSDRVERSKKGDRPSGIKPDKGYIGHKSAKMMKRSKVIESRVQTAIEEKSALLKNIETASSLKIHPLRYHTDRMVHLEDINIIFGKRKICEGVSFSIQSGDRIALCGKNGSGKSSIAKLILGETIPYQGIIRKGSRLKISYVGQDASGLVGSLTDYARESGIDETLLKTILRKLDFSRGIFDMDISDFSDGQKKKVMIVRSLCESAHLYIWDEPLNYIDVISRMQIEDLLRYYKPTLLFIEHDRAFCDNIATKTILL